MFNLKIFNNNTYSDNSAYLELSVKLKIETLDSGHVKISWLNGDDILFKFVENQTSISKTITNNGNARSRTIPDGNYTFDDFSFLKSLLDKVIDNFTANEIQLIKDFFVDGGKYSYKIDLGEYTVLDDFDGTSSIIAGTFSVANDPINSVYGYYKRFSEGNEQDICFKTAWPAEDDIAFEINPIYENKAGFINQDEVIFSSTNLEIKSGESNVCTTVTSPVDDALKEKQEFLLYEIKNVTNGKSGRNIPIRLTIEDW